MDMKGVIADIRPVLAGERLRVVARVRTEGWGVVEAYLPEREVAAFLPRYLLVGDSTRVPRRLLEVLDPMVRRLAGGRRVRLWRFRDLIYFSFPAWRGVVFVG